jgi:hypothetical protein
MCTCLHIHTYIFFEVYKYIYVNILYINIHFLLYTWINKRARRVAFDGIERYTYVYVYIYVYMFTYTYIHTYIFFEVYKYTYVNILYINIHFLLYTWINKIDKRVAFDGYFHRTIYIYVYIYTYVYMYVHMYIYTLKYTNIHI